jgi:membrane associated rhomboid family serine protease
MFAGYMLILQLSLLSQMEIVSEKKNIEKKRIFVSLFIPVIFVLVLGMITAIQWGTNLPFYKLGVLPREASGLIGIITAPLIHGGFDHYFSNALPLILLGGAMIYFYRDIAYSVFIWVWLLDGIGVWLFGRPVYHIGASGLIYGMAGFVFFSGVLRKNRNLLSLALAVIFMYGGMIWGIYPLENGISWEAHLFGLLSGIFCAIYFKSYGPGNDPVPEWMDKEDEDEKDEEQTIPIQPEEKQPSPPLTIIYNYKKDEKK